MTNLEPGDVVEFMWLIGEKLDLVPKRVGVIVKTKSAQLEKGTIRVYHDEDVWSVPITWCSKIS